MAYEVKGSSDNMHTTVASKTSCSRRLTGNNILCVNCAIYFFFVIFYFIGGYVSATPRQGTALSLHSEEGKSVPVASHQSVRKTVSEPPPVTQSRPVTSRTYANGGRQEYRITNHNNMIFSGDSTNNVRSIGGSGSRQGGSLAENRRRIAAILGRKR